MNIWLVTPMRITAHILRLGLVLSLISVTAAGALAESAYMQNATPEKSAAVCAKVGGLRPPASDRPGPEARKALRNCDSESLLYGVGRPVDPAKARQCAFVEMDRSDGETVSLSGAAILTTIYANGSGVPRNLALAQHFACDIDHAAEAETWTRVAHLEWLKTRPRSEKPFHICDDITSGMWAGQCAAHDGRMAEAKRRRAVGSLTQGWSAPQKAALEGLHRAQEAFIDAATSEVYAGGTIRYARWEAAADGHRSRGLALLRRLSRQGGFAATPGALAASDRRLNETYRRVMAPGAMEDWGSETIQTEDIRKAERAWILYRNAWTALAVALGRTKTERDGLALVLTDDRTGQLRCLPSLKGRPVSCPGF